ncbi:hypothetical protein FPY71_09585 [Aureimonas fodinaquatilis]|uniref:Uncharacterized protein n=1 Tax=Aureimonas fodinaquatilis TaxID=2565783 RepID=A0A5B0DVG1_9HYPH|nr:hypothetical protein [Aureimonas fodinaquatilis]KAA0970724.1 hypothetical protein FPY71_09585 [Aureimonas fodinaquatilis]
MSPKDPKFPKPEAPEDQLESDEKISVISNAIQRVENRYRGVPNDPSLIGHDLPEEEEDEDRDPWEEEEDPDKDRWEK